MAEIISAVYKITNIITGDSYIGSSKNIKRRWTDHKKPSTWKRCPNNQMYLDMKKYGKDKFEFQILAEVEPEKLKVAEQQFIEKLKPTYNNYRASGWDIERRKEYLKEYNKEYQKSYKYKEYDKSEKRKKAKKEYNSQLCCYNGEVLKLDALRKRFQRAGIPHPQIEAKKYLVL